MRRMACNNVDALFEHFKHLRGEFLRQVSGLLGPFFFIFFFKLFDLSGLDSHGVCSNLELHSNRLVRHMIFHVIVVVNDTIISCNAN